MTLHHRADSAAERIRTANALQADRNAAATIAAHERELHATDLPSVHVDRATLADLAAIGDTEPAVDMFGEWEAVYGLWNGERVRFVARLCRHSQHPNGTCLACGERTGAAS